MRQQQIRQVGLLRQQPEQLVTDQKAKNADGPVAVGGAARARCANMRVLKMSPTWETLRI